LKTLVDEYFKEKYQAPSILYHYTSTEVLLSIIKHKSLWLSDITKANDKRELSWVLTGLMKVFPSAFEKAIKDLNLEKVINIDIFLGDDGNGVSIGFDSNFLMKFQDNTNFEFAKVIYSKKKLEQFLRTILNNELKWFNYSQADLYNYQVEIRTLFRFIANEGFIFKNPYFSEEKEWRLVCNAPKRNLDFEENLQDYVKDAISTSYYKEIKGAQFSRSEIKFRSSTNDIISYVELGFAPICSNFIRRIVLGPKCKISEFDLRMLLHCNGYLNSFDDASIEIERSKIPYI